MTEAETKWTERLKFYVSDMSKIQKIETVRFIQWKRVELTNSQADELIKALDDEPFEKIE